MCCRLVHPNETFLNPGKNLTPVPKVYELRRNKPHRNGQHANAPSLDLIRLANNARQFKVAYLVEAIID